MPQAAAGRWKRLTASLLFRMMVFGLFLVVLGSAGRIVTLKAFIRENVEALAASEQLSIARYIARDIDLKVAARQRLLEEIAGEFPLTLLERPRELETWLAERQKFDHLFSLGLMVIPPDGASLIAEYPAIPGRRGLRFASEAWFGELGSRGDPVLAKTLRSRATGKPVLGMALPVKSAAGVTRAILVGVADLMAPDLFGAIQNSRLGENGGFLVVSPADRTFIVASNPAMTLTATPAPGINALHDRAMEGFRGTGFTVNAFGVEELSAIAAVPSTGWFVVAHMPTSEALAAVGKVEHQILIGGVVTAGIFLALVVTYLRRVLRPLRDTAERMRRMADGSMPLQVLPLDRPDEVGDVIAGFNRLAVRLNENEAALIERSRALEEAMADLNESEARMAHMAHHDTLTGLPNRALFEDRLRQALARADRSGKHAALFFLDLDGFKPINDNYGHDVGDAVLRQVADRLNESLRRADTVARIGGDEFVVLLADLDEPQDAAAQVAVKCLEAVSPAFLVDDLRLTVGLSVGVALYPEHGDGAATLLAHADQAMYRAKQNGRGCYEFFHSEP